MGVGRILRLVASRVSSWRARRAQRKAAKAAKNCPAETTTTTTTSGSPLEEATAPSEGKNSAARSSVYSAQTENWVRYRIDPPESTTPHFTRPGIQDYVLEYQEVVYSVGRRLHEAEVQEYRDLVGSPF